MRSPSKKASSPVTYHADLPAVLSVAFPFAPVGPAAVGGAEVVLSSLEAALPALGFRSIVVAHGDSQPGGRLYPTLVPAGHITDSLRAEVEAAQQRSIDRALAENAVSLVHMHGFDFHRYRIPAHLPVLVTLHLPPGWYPEAIWQLPAQYHFVCVSLHQRNACPASAHSRITVIANGVPLPPASDLRPAGQYALMMARICEEKNIHTGLEAARRAGVPVMLAGEVFPYAAHERYFAQQIEPRLTHVGTNHAVRSSNGSSNNGGKHSTQGSEIEPVARFLGPVAGSAKARLLARAACLLLPSVAPETSSLVAMEALAAGVPVIALASGATPEIIDEGQTGFLIQPGDEAAAQMAEAIARLHQLDRKSCRAVAERRFALPAMLDAYAALYRVLALADAGESLQAPVHAVPAQVAASVMPNVVVRQITTNAALRALAPLWADLWVRDTAATPFQHPAWLLPWWRQFGLEGDLCTVAIFDEQPTPQRLFGLLPVYGYPKAAAQSQTGAGQEVSPRLLPLGAGTSDYLDGVFDSSASPTALAGTALECALRETQSGGKLDFVQLRPTSALLAAARSFPPNTFTENEAEPCSLIDTVKELPAKLAANVRRYRRRAEADGPLTFTVAASPEEALIFFDELVGLHTERWQARAESGVLADPRVRAHHREAIPALLAAGLLRIFRCSQKNTENEVLGVLYALADPPGRPVRSLYLYLIGVNMRVAARSPGTLLLHAVWEYARAEGIARLDLLRGGEAYKHLWGAKPQPTIALKQKATDLPAAAPSL